MAESYYVVCALLLAAVASVVNAANLQVSTIQRCPTGCTCFNDYQRLVCTNINANALNLIPPAVRRLNIQSGHIPYIDANAFNAASHTLQSLMLQHASLHNLHKNAFFGLTNLQDLSLPYNTLNTVDGEWFTALTKLQHLKLNNNNIRRLMPEKQLKLVHLISLTLSHNSIVTLQNSIFKHLSSLEVLHLDHNSIESISTGAFNGLSKLRMLNLSYGQLQELKDGVFSSLLNLEVLDISNNNIAKLSRDILNGLENLRTLVLVKNRLTQLHSDTFTHLNNIEALYIDSNPLSSVARSFNIETLKILSLSSVHHLHITTHTFQGLTKLQYLNLSLAIDFLNTNSGYLTSGVPADAFSSLENVTSLDLSNNELVSLDEKCFYNMSSIKDIHLHGNRWHCNCSVLSWLRQLPVSQATLHSFQCHSPSTFSTINAVRVYYEALACDTDWEPTDQLHYTTVMTRIGRSGILQCLPNLFHISTTVWENEDTGELYTYHNTSPDVGNTSMQQSILSIMEAGKHERYYAELQHEERVKVLENGDLFIAYSLRADAGIYECSKHSEEVNKTATVVLRLNYDVIVEVKTIGCLIGWCVAMAVLMLSMFITCITDRSLRSCKLREEDEKSRKARHLRQMLIDLEAYHHEQILRLRLHYANQLQKLKGQCSMQAAKIGENYTQHIDKAKNYKEDKIYNLRQYKEDKIHALKDYRASKIDAWRDYKDSWRDYRDAKRDAWRDYKDSWRDYKDTKIDHLRDVRDNYSNQVTKLRESVRLQHTRAHEGYHQHILRVREYCAQQLRRFADTYKLKQKHIATIMDNFSSIDSCRTGNPQRADSMLFDPDISLENIFAASLATKLLDDLSFLEGPIDLPHEDLRNLPPRDEDVCGISNGSCRYDDSASNCQVHGTPRDRRSAYNSEDESGDLDYVSAASRTPIGSNLELCQRNTSDIPFADEEDEDEESVYGDTTSMMSSLVSTPNATANIQGAHPTTISNAKDNECSSSPLVLKATSL